MDFGFSFAKSNLQENRSLYLPLIRQAPPNLPESRDLGPGDLLFLGIQRGIVNLRECFARFLVNYIQFFKKICFCVLRVDFVGLTISYFETFKTFSAISLVQCKDKSNKKVEFLKYIKNFLRYRYFK